MRENLCQASPLASESWLGIFGIPWLVDAFPWYLPSSSKDVLPVLLSACKFPPFIRTQVILDLGSILFHYDHILTGYITMTLPISKWGCILRCWGLGLQYMNLGGTQFNPKQYPVYRHESWDSEHKVCVRHPNWVLTVQRPLLWSMRQPVYEVITFSNIQVDPAISKS